MEKRAESTTCSLARYGESCNPGVPRQRNRALCLISFLFFGLLPTLAISQSISISEGIKTSYGEIISIPRLEAAYLRSVSVSEDRPNVSPKRQRYTVPIGFFPSLFFRFGYWERQDTLCQVFVGRSLIPVMRHDGIQQNDLNWFLAPADSMSCLQMTMALAGIRGRHPEKGFFYFTSDQPCLCHGMDNDSCLSLEAENTPHKNLFNLIDQTHFPTSQEESVPIGNHPGLGRKHPGIGVYGPLCADYTHHGRPEIHPYHWLWYLAPPPDTGQLRWLVAHLPDKSGRFHKWSPDTLSGVIRIPVFCHDGVQIIITEANGTQHCRDIGPLGLPPLQLNLPVVDGTVQLSVCGPDGNTPGYVEIHDRTGAGRLFEILTFLCP